MWAWSSRRACITIGAPAPGPSGRPFGCLGCACVPEVRMGRPERILVADDDGSVRALLRALLDRAGYDVVEVADGDAALAAVATKGPIDLLVLDVNMPRRDGIEVTRRLRSQHSTELLPIILV